MKHGSTPCDAQQGCFTVEQDGAGGCVFPAQNVFQEVLVIFLLVDRFLVMRCRFRAYRCCFRGVSEARMAPAQKTALRKKPA